MNITEVTDAESFLPPKLSYITYLNEHIGFETRLIV